MLVQVGEQLVDPQRDVPAASIPIHGIEPAALAGAPTIDAVLPAFHAYARDTVLVAQVDMQGRLMGKRFQAEFFLESAHAETHACNYLLATDFEMETVPGYKATSWAAGYGDYVMRPDLATLRAELGSLDKVARFVELQGALNTTPEFEAHARVLDGASDLIAEIFGADGQHARSVIGVASLRDNVPLTLRAVIEIKKKRRPYD